MADAVLTDAVDLARDTAVAVAEDADAVGTHLGAVDAGERLVTHTFVCLLPGYRGWVWSVTLSRAPRGKDVNIAEATLTPADDALLAPAWVPWEDRVLPGDLEPTMALPLIEKDPRLVPGFEVTTDDDAMELWELGLGRERLLGPEGRDDVASRWYRGSHGPTAASAIASTEPCQTCAFFVPLTGSLRLVFGACTNEWSPSDGRVVSVDHGCGAHSQTDAEHGPTQWPAADPVYTSDGVVPFALGVADEPEVESRAEGADDAGAADDADTADGDDVAAEFADADVPGEGTAPEAESAPEADAEMPAEDAPAEGDVEPSAERQIEPGIDEGETQPTAEVSAETVAELPSGDTEPGNDEAEPVTEPGFDRDDV